MKKILFTLCLVLLSTKAFSQLKLSSGIRAGANFSKITNTDYDTKIDFYIGGFASLKFVNFYTLQPELTYSRQGAKASPFVFEGVEIQLGDIEIQYLNISIANKLSPFKDNGLHFIIGPSINVRLSDNSVVDYEGFDIVFFGGLGYDLPFGLTLEARYNIGLVDILGNNINNEVSFDEIYLNKYIQIGAAYKFDF